MLNNSPSHTVGCGGAGVLCSRRPPRQVTEVGEETGRGSLTPPRRVRVTQGPSVGDISDRLFVPPTPDFASVKHCARRKKLH